MAQADPEAVDMPTKRTKRTRNTRQRVTPHAVELFRQASALDAECDEYRELKLELHRELGLQPWHYSPLELKDNELEYDHPTHIRERVEYVFAFRRELVEAIKDKA